MFKRMITLLLFVSTPLMAQETNEKKAIKQVVRNMFIAMQTGDTALFRTCFAPSVIFQTVIRKQGQNQVKSEDFEAFLRSLSKYPKGALDERITFKSVQCDEGLASVWTPYEFYYEGKFAHQGVNSFQLVKLGDKWKIQYLIDTRKK